MAAMTTVEVSVTGVEPVRSFIGRACRAYALLQQLPPGELSTLPRRVADAAEELREAVHDLIGEGLITAEQVEDLYPHGHL